MCSGKRTGTVDYAGGQGSGLDSNVILARFVCRKLRSHRASIILPSGNQKRFWRAFYGFFYDRARKLGIDGTTRERRLAYFTYEKSIGSALEYMSASIRNFPNHALYQAKLRPESSEIITMVRLVVHLGN